MTRPNPGARGQGLVEFALVLPIALLIILALFDLGRAVFVYNGLTNAAREGARLAVVNQDKDDVTDRVADMTIGIGLSNAGDPDDVVSFFKQLPNDDPTANDECSTLAVGCVAVVVARAEWSAITPIIGSIVGPISLEARSELPVEFVCPNDRIASYPGGVCPRTP